MTLETIRNFGIIAHIDAGKTTTTERMLYYARRIHRVGNVDEGTTTTDWYELEKRRGITIFSAAVTCEWRDHMLNLIDTPGHVDFTAEVERSLRVLDGAVVVFDGVAGVEAQSETVWRQAGRYGVPRIAYVNKMDRAGADFAKALETMREKLQARPVPVTIPWGGQSDFHGVIDVLRMRALTFEGDRGEEVRDEDIPGDLRAEADLAREELLDAASEFSDALLEKVVEGDEVSAGEIVKALRRGTISGAIQPVFAGSSLHNQGVQPLLDAVVDLLPSPLDVPEVRGVDPESGREERRHLQKSKEVCALAFKTSTDRHGELTYVRVYSGTLNTRLSTLNPRTGKKERVSRIVRMFSNDRSEQLSEAGPGEIVAVVGLKHTWTGDTLCDRRRPIVLGAMHFAEPVVTVSIEPRSSADKDRLEEVLGRLAKDDPTFRTSQDEETGQTLLHCMGELHAEILLHRIT
ncbi:MAG: elongation factor G, partial [Planctomycetota bacterium]